jgi:hypothetical protein
MSNDTTIPVTIGTTPANQDLILYRLGEMEKSTKERFDKIDDKLEHMTAKFIPREEAKELVEEAKTAAAKDLLSLTHDVNQRFDNYKWAVRALTVALLGAVAGLFIK